MISPGWTRLQKSWYGASCAAVHTAPQFTHAYRSVVSALLLCDIGGLLHVGKGLEQPDGHIPRRQAHIVTPYARPARRVGGHLQGVAVGCMPGVLRHGCKCGHHGHDLLVE